jgi:hypothetical protein
VLQLGTERALFVSSLQGLEALHPGSLEMAEALAAAGYRLAVYRGAAVLRQGEQQAQVAASFDPVVEDSGLQAHGSGR